MPPKKSKPAMVQDATEAFKEAFEPGEAASLSVSAGLSKIKALAAPAPPPPPPPPAPAPAPVEEPDLGPGGAEFITAMLMGGPDAVRELEQRQQQQPNPPLPGFGNIPSMKAPDGLPSAIQFGPPDGPEKRPVGRPRSNSAPRPPPPVKVEATDSQMSQRVLLETKIKAYMRLRPALKEMVRVPVPGSPIEDFEWCLAQCRQCLSWGVEEKALKMALGAGVGVLEQSLPYLREWVPEGQAHHLHGEGISEDLRRTLDERNVEQEAVDFRECLSLCAVDLIGWVSFSPWLMLGFSMLAMFNRRVSDNNQAMLEDARNRTMQRGVSLSGVQTNDL